jgi:hypothetical protein
MQTIINEFLNKKNDSFLFLYDLITLYVNILLKKLEFYACFILSKSFFIYSDSQYLIKSKFDYYYKNNTSFKNTVDRIIYDFQYMKNGIAGRCVEPFEQNWVSISLLTNNYKFIEYYTEIHPIVDNLFDKKQNYYTISMNNDLLIKTFYTICEYSKIIYEYLRNINDISVILKMGDRRVSYVFYRKKIQYNNIQQPMTISPVKFIAIKYSHPEMADTFYLELDNSIYYEGNELFSPVFIRRCLEYQTENFIFDKNYKLTLVDNNIDTIELTSKEYIVLDNGYYNIMVMDMNSE